MKHTRIQKLTLAGLFCAIAVVGSMFSFPMFGSKCAPIQHMINVLCAVLLGPYYGIGVAFAASLIRNLTGLGSLMAFPGSMVGALLCGLAYHKTRSLPLTLLAEVFGTAVLGGLCAYPVSILLMGNSAGEIAFYAYIVPFLVSTAAGSVISGVLVCCANLLLAAGASPIMADAPEEAAEITARSQGLTLNLGTLQAGRIPVMLASGRQANRSGIPAVLDPVGAGASAFRTRTARQLLEEVRFAVIRGNLSEIQALAAGAGHPCGVDAGDRITPQTLDAALELARQLARRTGAVVAVTGETDLVTDGRAAFCIHNGHPMMRHVTGAGCQLSCLTAAFAAASPGQTLQAAAAAVCAMGLCGEIAYARLAPQEGNAAYRDKILDAVYRLTPAQLEEGARYELR